MEKKIILIAGATGNLGTRIVKALLTEGAEVRAVVRQGSDKNKLEILKNLGAVIIELDMNNTSAIAHACTGVSCVVSALAGLEEVILGTQKIVLDAAVIAGVPRFIPSDYSLDFTPFKEGENRNLDLRRRFHTYLDQQPIKATSIFNGAFMELLNTDMPMIIKKQKLVIYWGQADHKMVFTTLDNTAAYTAKVAMDSDTPRYLRIAGDYISPREIKEVVNTLTPQKFRLFKTGGLGLLSLLIKIAKRFSSGETELYPAWQGMQYMRNMMDERAVLKANDNGRYEGMKWARVKEMVNVEL